MTKLEIINEIKRTAAANGGVPLGWKKFITETGIGEAEWKGKLWARWSEAVRDAGFAPNAMTKAYGGSELLDKYAKLALDFGRLPTNMDIRLKISGGLLFPDWATFKRTFGGKSELVAKLRDYCQTRSEYAAVVALCDGYVPRKQEEPIELLREAPRLGFVYLMKSAKYYKIGKASVTGRRHRELAIQMPEKLIFVHEIGQVQLRL